MQGPMPVILGFQYFTITLQYFTIQYLLSLDEG